MNEDYLARRLFPDGREAVVWRLSFGRARISIGPAGEFWFDDNW